MTGAAVLPRTAASYSTPIRRISLSFASGLWPKCSISRTHTSLYGYIWPYPCEQLSASLSGISREDVADFILKHLRDVRYLRQCPAVG
jgi:hypothetical protein